MKKLKWIAFIIVQILFANLSNGQVTVSPQGLSQSVLQVHDSISPFTEFKLTHGLNTGQGIKMRMYSLGEADFHNRLGDLTLKAGATGPGAYMFLEQFGNIGIGYPKFSATHALHINDTDPLRLQGLTTDLTYDTVLVVSPTGVIHKRAQNTFPASYWTKSGNYVFNLADSIGIGVSSPTERLSVADGVKIISSSDNSSLKMESVFINSELGQYRYGTSELLLNTTLPASGLTYLKAKKGTSDVVSSQGFLLNVETPKPIILATNDAEVMRIDSSGNVGIGTNTPVERLHVDGKAIIEDTLIAEKIKLGVGKNQFIYPSASGLKIQNGETYGDSRSNIVIHNGFGHFMRMEEKTIDFISGSKRYLLFDGKSSSVSINTFTTTPRETLDVGGSIVFDDTLRISGFDKMLSGKGGSLEVISDEPINITADLSDVTISDGIFPYAIFDGSTRNFGLLNSGPVTKKLEVGGSGLFHDSIFVNTLQNVISSTSLDQLKIESGKDIILSPAANLDLNIEMGGSNFAVFKGSTQRLGIGITNPQERLDVNGTIETDKIKITDGAIPGRVLVSDGNGLGSWSTVPPDGDWTITGMDMQSGVPGNINVGIGIAQNSKWNVNGSIANSILVVASPSYNLTANDYTVVLTNPGAVAFLPAANTCPGRIYNIKFMLPGGTINTTTAADLIDNMAALPVPPPLTIIATTITVQSDGGTGWWIINS